jgi:hypothetical protein
VMHAQRSTTRLILAARSAGLAVPAARPPA